MGPDKPRHGKIRTVVQVTSGNFLEMYDFIVYGLYASFIAATFFPEGDEFASQMKALVTFGAGFLMRPLGAIILGAYIDRKGRRVGLVPGVVQDAATGEILMLGFLNPVSYAKTLESGLVTFWSRTRQKLWMKGETSGNRLRIVSTATDCDNDTLLFRVEVEGDGLVCHEGTVSCFTRPIALTPQNTEASRG